MGSWNASSLGDQSGAPGLSATQPPLTHQTGDLPLITAGEMTLKHSKKLLRIPPAKASILMHSRAITRISNNSQWLLYAPHQVSLHSSHTRSV
jgi:hypothetical protein